MDPNYYKDQFGVEGRTVLLTFGLLSPNKGIEHVLNALPQILAEFPDVVYIVLGATHPHELDGAWGSLSPQLGNPGQKEQGGEERHFLQPLRGTRGVEGVHWCCGPLHYPLPQRGADHFGNVSLHVGAGKAVVSTPYWHAAELLAEERGVLVPFGDSRAIGREVCGLLRDPTRRNAIRKNAYKLGREMVWSNVARLYMQSFEQARLQGASVSRKLFATKTLDQQPRDLPKIRLDHLSRMTDSTGIFQHAVLTVPNFSQGYCTDEMPAFILSALLDELKEEPARVSALSSTYAAFLNYAFDDKTKRFHNFLSFDRRWLDEQGSEDCHARALWALGVGVGRSPHRSFQIMSGQLFAQALPIVTQFTSPRAWAFCLIGIHEYLRRLDGDRSVNQIRETLIARLMDIFDRASHPDWPWFEEELSYDNAKLAHALILGGRANGHQEAFDRGLKALRWLAEVQTSEHGHFRPIGSNGFYHRGGTRSSFDQQPIEAHSMVSACLEAYRATSDTWWYEEAHRAFDWFLGWNDLGLELHSVNTGGCHDALHVDRVNANQGAEWTLAFLLSLAEMQLMQNAVTVFSEPAL